LRRAERMLVRACRSGAIAKVGLRLPVAPSAEIGVRSSLLAFILRGTYLVDAISYSKVEGKPFKTIEIENKVLEVIQ